MINRAILTGRLTRDVDLRYTQSGRARGQFTLAVDRNFTDSNGQRQADFINCVIWGKSAESFANFMHKGSLVGIDGQIQTRNYENNQGQRVYVTEIKVDNWSFLESRNSNNGNANGGGNYGGGNSYGNGNNTNNYNNNSNGNSYNAPSRNGNSGFNQGGGNYAPQGNNDQGFGPKPNPNQGNQEPRKKDNDQDDNEKDPFKNKGDKIDISDDDLPF